MKKIITGIVLMFAVLMGLGTVNASAKENLKVLFIGNSFTYYNNAANMFKEVAETRGKSIEVTAATNGGQNLIYNATATNVVANIKKDKYDVVVLQDKVGSNFKKEDLMDGLKKIVPIIKQYSPDAQLVLYEPWPTRDKIDAKMSYFTQSYIEGAKTYNALLAPVGESIYDLYKNYKKDYICNDKKHPQPLATFAVANTLYYTLYPEEAKHTITKSDQSKLDSIINSNACFTTDGLLETYAIEDLIRINDLAYKYSHAVINAAKGIGTYVSVGADGWKPEPVTTTAVDKVSVLGKSKPVIKKAKKKGKKLSIKLKASVKYANGYIIRVYKTKKNAKKNKKCIYKYTVKKNTKSITIKNKKFKKCKKVYVVAQAYMNGVITTYYSKKSTAKVCK